jgi:hypothetical protein
VNIAFDHELALTNFHRRKEENKGKQIDNSSQPAGSPIRYYCRYCGAHTQTLPECHNDRIKTVCDACEPLVLHGCIT